MSTTMVMEIIQDELFERGWDVETLAKQMGWPTGAVVAIVEGHVDVGPLAADALALAFGTSAETWLNLQRR